MNANKLSSQSWLSAYLYYNEPWENFLANAVAPFVQQVRQSGLADQFFSIRYWEKGPHIRLRFKGDAATLENEVKPALMHHFSTYFTAHPSLRADPSWLDELPEAEKWMPNNSVQFVNYEPETGRYGGETCLLISEQQFQASSEAVLAILQENDQWDYNRASGVAIQLHLGFASASGMDLSEARCFFSKVFECWLPRSYFSFQQHQLPGQLSLKQDEVLQAFRRSYEKQKNHLLPQFKTIWKALEGRAIYQQEWYNEFLQRQQKVNNTLQQAQAIGQLITPEGYSVQPHHLIPVDKRQRWALYESYIHMTNNRLGILNRDEGYLAYLIKEGLKEMMLL